MQVKSLLIAGFALCLSCVVQAKNIEKVVVFTDNTTDFTMSVALFDSNVVTEYNLDMFQDADDTLNRLVQAKAKSMTTPSHYARMRQEGLMDLYQKAFFEVQKSSEFEQTVTQLRHGATAMMMMVQYDIQALPAIVINDDAVLYGVTNVDQAIAQYVSSKDESHDSQ